jgi:hypothetical protein
MRRRALAAVGAAAMVLLIGPGVAWADAGGGGHDATTPDPAVQGDQSGGSAQEPAASQNESTGAAEAPDTDVGGQETAVGPAAPADTADSSAGASETADSPAPEAESSAAPAPDASVSGDQPQAEIEAPANVTLTKSAGSGKRRTAVSAGNCLTRAGATTRQAPSGPGCTAPIPRGHISRDPANPTLITANGVTVAIWTIDRPQGGELDWAIVSGTLPPGATLDITILRDLGPSSPTALCQVSATAPTGSCHLPERPNGKWWPLNHIVICASGATTPPGVTPPPGGTGTGGGGGGGGPQGIAGQKKKGGHSGVGGVEEHGTAPVLASASAAAVAAGNQLPFTGLQALWLVLIGGALLGSGMLIRASRTE